MSPEERAALAAIEKELEDLERELFPFLESEEKDLCERSLYAYVQSSWSSIDSSQFVGSWHIEAICEHLEAMVTGEIRDLIVTMPPRAGKSSTIGVALPTWLWIKDPSIQLITASYGADLATRDSVKSRRLIQSPWYQKFWGKLFKLDDDNNLKSRYSNNKNGSRLSTSVGGTATGEGYTWLILDDALKAGDAQSDIKRQSCIDWFQSTVSTRANNPETARRVCIGQRLHAEDLPGWLMDNSEGSWEVLNLPARYEPTTYVTRIGWEDPRTKDGELLCPGRFNEEQLSKLERELGPWQASAQLQQRPVPKGASKFPRDKFQFYFAIPDRFDEVLCSWDTAFDSETISGSGSVAYTVGQVWGRLAADYYLVDEARGKWDINQQVYEVEMLALKHPSARRKLIENKSTGKPIVKLLQRKVNGFTLIEPKDYGGSKESRAESVVPIVCSGNVYLPHPSLPGYSWIGHPQEHLDHNKDSWLNEVTMFPKAKFKDRVDTMTQAINYMEENRGSEATYLAREQNHSAASSRNIFAESEAKVLPFGRHNVRGIFG